MTTKVHSSPDAPRMTGNSLLTANVDRTTVETAIDPLDPIDPADHHRLIANLQRPREFVVPELDAATMRANVAAKLFGTQAEPVKIGRFDVLRRIGAGGMGIVYAAYDQSLDRKVAVKVLHAAHLPAEELRRLGEQLMREAQALARLSHPNVVQVYEVGEFRGQVFLAMEFLGGASLRETEVRPTANWRHWLEPWVAAAKGLAAAHGCGLVHRDFKPENAKRATDGTVKVLDFGLASDPAIDPTTGAPRSMRNSTLDSDAWIQTAPECVSTLRTRSGQIAGTPAYMSPEQHRGEPADARSDQFSFCVALWEAIYGVRPFAGTTLAELASNVLENRRAVAPTNVRVPKWLTRVLERGLSPNPNDRYRSMLALVAELERDRLVMTRRLGMAAGGISLAAAVWLSQPSAASPCDALKESAASRFTAQTAQSIRSALTSAGWTAESPATATLLDHLHRYAENIGLHESNACQNALVDGKESLQIYGARMSCLARRTSSFDALTQALVNGNEIVAKRALEATVELPDLETCIGSADDPELAATPLNSDDRSTLDTVEKLIAQAHTAWNLRRAPESLEGIDRAIELAKRIHHKGSLARAYLAKGRLEFVRKNHEGALEALAKAREVATESGDHRLKIDAYMAELGYTNVLRSEERVRTITQAVEAEFALAGQPREQKATYLIHLGRIASTKDEPCAALAYFEEALKIRTDVFGANDQGVADLWERIGRLHYLSFGRLESATKYLQRAHELYSRSLGSEHWHTKDVEVRFAMILADQIRELVHNKSEKLPQATKDARASFERQLATPISQDPKESKQRAKIEYNYGRFLQIISDFTGAVESFRRAIDAFPENERLLPRLGLIQTLHQRGDTRLAREAFDALGQAVKNDSAAPYFIDIELTELRLLARDYPGLKPDARREVDQRLASVETALRDRVRAQEASTACLAPSVEPVPATYDLAVVAELKAEIAGSAP